MPPIRNVDLSVLCSNAAVLKSRCERLFAVVKADAYGHGLERVVGIVPCDGFCVARAEEALSARAVTSKPILVMGRTFPEETEALIRANVTLALVDRDQIPDFARAAKRVGKRARVRIKVDTGMHRYGFSPKEAAVLTLPPEIRRTGAFSHLAASDEARVRMQIRRGGASLDYPATANLRLGGTVRIGLGLYGYGAEGVARAMTVTARVVAVRDVEAGEYVGYGDAFRTTERTRIAVVDCGYADGLRRTVNRGSMRWKNRRLRMVGSVCMDAAFLDATGTAIEVGDEVTVLDDADAAAKEKGGIPYEYLTCWTARVGKRYTGG